MGNELDVNTDCKLTAEEVLAHFKGHGQDELPAGLMENEDKNSDGFISWEEFGRPGSSASGRNPPRSGIRSATRSKSMRAKRTPRRTTATSTWKTAARGT